MLLHSMPHYHLVVFAYIHAYNNNDVYVCLYKAALIKWPLVVVS